MIDFSKIGASISITPQWILSRITQEAIFSYYFQPFKIGKAYCSKLRRDRTPSVYFKISSKGNIILNDAASGEYWNCFSYVSALFTCNFNNALRQIAHDFGLVDRASLRVPNHIIQASQEIEKKNRESSLIQFIPDKWTKRHLDYWRQYEISKEELECEQDIFPVKSLFVNKREIYNPDNDLRFAYVQKYEDKIGLKIYSPYSKNMKWMSSLPLTIPFGMDKLPYTSDTVYITKSWKDRKVLKKLFSDVIATQNEGEASFITDIQEHLKSMYPKRVIIWGADDQGVNACKLFNDKGFGYFNTPKSEYVQHGIEDPADYVSWYGTDAIKELFKQKGLL